MIDKQPENSGEFSIILSLDYGQVVLETESIKEFYFIESISNYCITGKLKFFDQYGVFEIGPITGNEMIAITYGEEDNIDKVFYIYKMSKIEGDATVQAGTTQTIDIFFTDSMFYGLNFLQFSKSGKDEKISDIIFDISEDILGVSKWDGKKETSNKLEYFYSPYWSPHTSLDYLLKRGEEISSKTPGLCGYNNSKGSNLVSIDTLLNQSKLMTIDNEDDGIYVFEDSNLFLFNKILHWSISGIDNTALRNLSGRTLLRFNNNTKTFNVIEKKYTDMLKNHVVLGKNSLYNDKSDVKNGFEYRGDDNDTEIETMYQHNGNKLYDNQQIININVRGHENRYCGGMIEIKGPSMEQTTQIFNSNLQGKYLIKSITHYFSGYVNPSYSQKLVLIKNGYEDSQAKELVKSTKRNLAK